jgi:hypothetical protein
MYSKIGSKIGFEGYLRIPGSILKCINIVNTEMSLRYRFLAQYTYTLLPLVILNYRIITQEPRLTERTRL